MKFLNFRSQWQGGTVANLERIFTLLKALWPSGHADRGRANELAASTLVE